MSTTHQQITPTITQPSRQREIQSSLAYPSRTIVHVKLEMTEPGDHDEQEADAMANTIVSGGKISRKISGGGGSSGIAVSQQMESQLSQPQGGGRQMPEGLRNMMESGFGQDFSQVRLHTDSEAANMSSSIHAKAFTLGNDIYFNQGQFSPNTTEGQRLVAHELTHVVQGTGKVGRQEVNHNDLDISNSVEQFSFMQRLLAVWKTTKDNSEKTDHQEANTINNHILKAIENEAKNYNTYGNQGAPNERATGKSFNIEGPKCNLFVVNMLFDAYKKMYNKTDDEVKKTFLNMGLFRDEYATNGVFMIHYNIIHNINKTNGFIEIKDINAVEAGDIVIWVYRKSKSTYNNKSVIETPHHIEIVTKRPQEQKNGKNWDLLSIGAHKNEASELKRSIVEAKKQDVLYYGSRNWVSKAKEGKEFFDDNTKKHKQVTKYSIDESKKDDISYSVEPTGPIAFYRFNV